MAPYQGMPRPRALIFSELHTPGSFACFNHTKYKPLLQEQAFFIPSAMIAPNPIFVSAFVCWTLTIGALVRLVRRQR